MKRLYSIDAFRGFDMLFLAGLMGMISSACLLFPSGEQSALFAQMDHAVWNGFHVCDVIFPTFLFIAGMSWPFSYESKVSKGLSRGKIYLQILRRFVILFLLGLVYNGLLQNFRLSELRTYSVLGRIGFCWAVSCVLFMNFGRKTRELIAAVLLIGYYVLLRFVPVPGAQGLDPLSLEGNLVGYVDRQLGISTLYNEVFDPEGVLSNMSAIVTAMLGVFTGELLHDTRVSDRGKIVRMLVSAASMIVVGLVWSRWFPVNKSLWTSTFVLVAGGVALALFSLFYYIIDVRGYRKWAFPFKVVGMNSITIYLATQLIPFGAVTDNLFGGLSALLPEIWQPLAFSTGYTVLCWLFLYFLYKKNVFLKV